MIRRRPLGVALLALLLACAAAPAAAQLAQTLAELDTRNFRTKLQVAEQVADSGHPRASVILSALLDGNLYLTPSGRAIIRSARNAPAVDALSGEPAEAGGARKVIINNLMRLQLREMIARLDVTHPDLERRLSAAKALYGELRPDGVDTIRALIADEPEPRVRDALETAVALAQLESADTEVRLDAVERLAGSLKPDVRNALRGAGGDESQPAAVRSAADAALAAIERTVSFYQGLEQV
ncbi:MAG TPA: hypothetical protein VJ947_07710, partial [Pseudohaliea sp.]|nr:hypothetical protein [Pseudohaliea sp.]